MKMSSYVVELIIFKSTAKILVSECKIISLSKITFTYVRQVNLLW